MSESVILQGEEWRRFADQSSAYNPEVDADIVAAARRRISEIRMRAIELRLIDASGQPLAHVPVEIEQLQHAFLFGDQLWTLDAMVRAGEAYTDRARVWKERFVAIFNAATNLCYWTERPENDAAKMEDRQGEPRLASFAETVDWTLSQGMIAKGHPLFWSIPKCVPAWVQRYPLATQIKFAEVRVRNLVARFRGRVRLWDAVNEPLWEPALQNFSRRQWPYCESAATMADYIAQVLAWCREEDPDACYLINDYGLEKVSQPLTDNRGAEVTAATQRQRLRELLAVLADRDSLPDAIGLQSHTGWATPREQWEAYDELAVCGLPLHITEFWARTRELEETKRYSAEAIAELQDAYIQRFLTCAFGHPAVEAFFFWGFLDAALVWRDRSGHSLRPIYHTVRRLLRDEWMTREQLRTDAEGLIRFRGFLGEYAVRILDRCGQRRGRRFTVERGSTLPLTVRLTGISRISR